MDREPTVIRRWVALPWGRLCVYVSGKGPPVLALHGLGGSGRYWNGLMTAMNDEAMIIAPDLPGFGASDRPNLSYDRTFHLDSLDLVVEALGIDRPQIVVGHSMGGVLAALWAARHGDAVCSVILVASPYPAALSSADERIPGTGRTVLHRALEIAWPVVTLPYRSRIYPRAVILDYPRHTSRSYWLTRHHLLLDASAIDELRPLTVRKHRYFLLYASDDKTVSLAALNRWAELLPGARIQVASSGGHQLLLASRFDVLAGRLREEVAFLDQPQTSHLL